MTVSADRVSRGLVVVYTWQVEPAAEEAFREHWRTATLQLRELGALGSCLTRDEEGRFVAIALWPDAQTRAEAFARLAPLSRTIEAVRIGEVQLLVEDDLWLCSSFRRQDDEPA